MPTYPYSVPIVNGGASISGTTGWTQLVGSGMAQVVPSGQSNGYLRPGSNAQSQVGQVIDLDSSLWPDIDAGLLSVTGSYTGTGFSGDADRGSLALEFYSGAGATGNYTAEIATAEADHPTSPTTANYSVGPRFLPAGTRSLRLSIRATRADGTNNDAYSANFAVSLTMNAKPHKQVFFLQGTETTGWTKTSGGGTLGQRGGWSGWATPLPGLVGVGGTWLGYRDILLTDLPSAALADIDAGTAVVAMHGMMGSFNSIDAIRVMVEARDGSNTAISTPLDTTKATRSSRTVPGAYSAALPANTRRLRLYYYTDGTDGANADGFMSRLGIYVEANNVMDAVASRRRHAAMMIG